MMGKYLDLDDVAAGNPVAEKELQDLRERVKELGEECETHADDARSLRAENERLRADNEFLRKRRGQLVIERDQARDDMPEAATQPPAQDGESESEVAGWEHSELPSGEHIRRELIDAAGTVDDALTALNAAEKAGCHALRQQGDDERSIAAETGFLINMDHVRNALRQRVPSVPDEVRRLPDYFDGMSQQLPQSPESSQAWAQAAHMLRTAIASAPTKGGENGRS